MALGPIVPTDLSSANHPAHQIKHEPDEPLEHRSEENAGSNQSSWRRIDLQDDARSCQIASIKRITPCRTRHRAKSFCDELMHRRVERSVEVQSLKDALSFRTRKWWPDRPIEWHPCMHLDGHRAVSGEQDSPDRSDDLKTRPDFA
jgi:hypothetical protein